MNMYDVSIDASGCKFGTIANEHLALRHRVTNYNNPTVARNTIPRDQTGPTAQSLTSVTRKRFPSSAAFPSNRIDSWVEGRKFRGIRVAALPGSRDKASAGERVRECLIKHGNRDSACLLLQWENSILKKKDKNRCVEGRSLSALVEGHAVKCRIHHFQPGHDCPWHGGDPEP